MHIDPKKNMQLILDTLDKVSKEVEERDRKRAQSRKKPATNKQQFNSQKFERICEQLIENNEALLRNHKAATRQLQSFTDALDKYATYLEKKAGIKL